MKIYVCNQCSESCFLYENSIREWDKPFSCPYDLDEVEWEEMCTMQKSVKLKKTPMKHALPEFIVLCPYCNYRNSHLLINEDKKYNCVDCGLAYKLKY